MSLTARQVYQSGASTSVECVSCGETSTTASWRKGWPIPGGQYANMCNRCGQSWVKLGRPGSLAQLREAERRKAAGGGAAAAGSKRPAADASLPPSPLLRGVLAGQEAGAAKRPRLPPLALALPLRPRRRLSSGEESPSSSADTTTPSLGRQVGHQEGPPAWSRSFDGPAAHPTPQQQWARSLAASGGPRFVSYAVQKLTSGKAAHALFWLQDERGDSTLAAVGTDARLSGHFIYSSCPAFLALGLAPPLRVTNRGEVAAWLAGFGVAAQVDDSSVRLPELSAEEKSRVLNPESPVWARPEGLRAGSWTGVREESGRLADGRHFKRFWMLGPGGADKLVVTGVDSSRKDRRYKYFAEEEMGGFAFENAREVMAWVNYALCRPADAPLEPEQVRCPQALREEDLGSLAARIRAAAQQERTPLMAPAAPRASPASKQHAGNSAAAPASPAGSPYTSSLSGKVRPAPQSHPAPAGSSDAGDSPPPSPLARPPAAGASAQPAPAPAAAGGVRPPLPRIATQSRLVGLRCATCGLTCHTSDECLLAVISPPSLLIRTDGGGGGGSGHHRTFSLLLTHPAPGSATAGGSGGGSGHEGEEEAWQPLPSPQLLSGGCPHCIHSAPFPAFLQAFAADPDLFRFVASAPSDSARDAFARWAAKLNSHISDSPPPLPTSELDTPLGGWSWTPTVEALAILRELSTAQVSLNLLQKTGIAGAVAQLRNHRDHLVASAAEGIVAKWRAAAVSALDQATRA
ncbi:hypothetical protein CHLNCDRAFT_49761 [Chlorella variabilis]|uniref:TFIIS N-terminal domain-containing protein n=1 Tax=Chlorella variabilis TaxID=554065 RepID=E1Z3Y1_CHLVA|nr:hypothetical protein CHLNCDRAFT_49761 [Chlorella variabilis]EFN59254.1 hypothetical protein CHLNCDRAFT_49761 [Chlorella variabilis]|eukprot:XP_005851356.1 hypothetical protein CHLNCDRAFT_49761 [Chlorella variabilis]